MSTTAFSAILFDVQAIDPLTFAIVVVTMLSIAAVAAYIPARRGLSVSLLRAVTTDQRTRWDPATNRPRRVTGLTSR
jgi:hypothetical protein